MEGNEKEKWGALVAKLEGMFDMEINIESILFLIGLREIGSNGKREFSKEEKVDLMHIAMCRLLSSIGYYELKHIDQDGWPHWELIKPIPYTEVTTQTKLLRTLILDYFDTVFA